jgi:hypothetical protein
MANAILVVILIVKIATSLKYHFALAVQVAILLLMVYVLIFVFKILVCNAVQIMLLNVLYACLDIILLSMTLSVCYAIMPQHVSNVFHKILQFAYFVLQDFT